MKCRPCEGTGKRFGSSSVQACEKCDGRAEIDDHHKMWGECRRCIGTGRARAGASRAEYCSTCDGLGLLRPQVEQVGPVYLIKAGTPHTAHEILSKIIGSLNGIVRVCDPYLHEDMFDKLRLLCGSGDVLVLGQNLDQDKHGFVQAVKRFTIEFPRFHFRYDNQAKIHDRYLLSDEQLIILGHGLKDIGMKDSFIVELDKQFVGDMILAVQESFDEKWTNATSLP